jgi:hypothetical protein
LNAKLIHEKQLGAVNGFWLVDRLETNFAVLAMYKNSGIPIGAATDLEDAQRSWVATDGFNGCGGTAGVSMRSRFHALMLRALIRKCDLKFFDLTGFLDSKIN